MPRRMRETRDKSSCAGEVPTLKERRKSCGERARGKKMLKDNERSRNVYENKKNDILNKSRRILQEPQALWSLFERRGMNLSLQRVDFCPNARQGPWSAPWVSALGQKGRFPQPLHTTIEKKCAGIPRWVYCVGLSGANIRVQNKGGGSHEQ